MSIFANFWVSDKEYTPDEPPTSFNTEFKVIELSVDALEDTVGRIQFHS